MSKFVFNIKGRTQADLGPEQGAEQYIWASQGRSDRRIA